jgi:hypothetical protein
MFNATKAYLRLNMLINAAGKVSGVDHAALNQDKSARISVCVSAAGSRP